MTRILVAFWVGALAGTLVIAFGHVGGAFMALALFAALGYWAYAEENSTEDDR